MRCHLTNRIGVWFVILFTGTKTRKECDGPDMRTFGCECLEFVIDPQIFWKEAVDKCFTKGGQLVTIR